MHGREGRVLADESARKIWPFLNSSDYQGLLVFTACWRPFTVKKQQLEDDTKRVKPHIKSTPMTSSYSHVELAVRGLLTLLRGGIQKGKEGGDVPTYNALHFLAIPSRSDCQQKCVIRKKAVMFSTITSCYSLLIRVNLCTCNAPFTRAIQDFLGLD